MPKNEILNIEALYKKRRRKIPRLKIAEAINQSGLTYQEIADQLGMKHYQNITKLKKAEDVRFKTLLALALVLECRVSDLYVE